MSGFRTAVFLNTKEMSGTFDRLSPMRKPLPNEFYAHRANADNIVVNISFVLELERELLAPPAIEGMRSSLWVAIRVVQKRKVALYQDNMC